jgi:hypothetical protein
MTANNVGGMGVVYRWLGSMAACGSILAACSSESPVEVAETHNELQRGPEAMVYNLGWRVDQHLRFVADIGHDQLGDLVGIGNDGVFIADAQPGTGYTHATWVLADFGNNQGWTNAGTVRTLADVDGDGRLDVVGFGPGSVKVALNTEEVGFDSAPDWTTEMSAADGYTAAHARFAGDVTGDGKADIVGIDDWGVYVATPAEDVTPGSWFFKPKRLWVRAFSQSLGWDSSRHLRLLTDVDGDQLADLVGFGETGVWVSKSNGVGFLDPVQVSTAFGYDTGWRIGTHVRAVANLNADRYADLIGLGPNGVEVALGNASGFDAPQTWSPQLGDSDGWLAAQHVRLIGDVDADGRDDVVGIKNDHVYVAHNNGGGLDTLVPVSDEFTTTKGWDVAKHPRFITDVDGDRQLELVGFFNDAVYWDRLTPTATIPSDWTTPTCAASRLAPPAPGFCEGPWRYTKTNRTVSQDPSCQKVCAANTSCAKWENGVTTITTSETPSPAIVGSGTRTCAKLCNNLGCRNPTCSGTISQPTIGCSSAAASRLTALRSAAAAAVANEASFDSAAAQTQRSAQAQSAAAATPNYTIDQYDYTTDPGPGGTWHRWKERWVCSLSVKTPNPVLGSNEACGCNSWVNGTCEHDTGTPSTLFTNPGILRPAGAGIANQECLTYDDLPATTPAQVQAKFEKLWSAQTLAPTTVTSDAFQRALVNRIKLLYELWGEQLVNQQTPPGQLQRAISLYRTFPNINPSCGTVDAPSPSPSCNATSVTATRGDLIRCQRLVEPHASDGVASIAMTDCTTLLGGYLDLKANAEDATCGGPHLRDVTAKTAFRLEDKQLGLITSAPLSLGALPRQLWLLDTWYSVSKRADSLGVFATADQQRRDTSYLLGRFWDRMRKQSGADAQLAGLSQSSTPLQAEQALGLAAVASRQSDQAVVNALFTVPGVIVPENVTLTRPPLRGLPLLAMLGDALKPLVDDLDGLALYHDIACQFRDCRAPSTNTPSRNAWKILASLEESSFSTNVSANPFALGGWTTTLGKIASQHSVLTQAIADAVTTPGGLAAATAESHVHPLARPLWLHYKHARAFHDHYEATGLFDPTAQNRLYGSLLEQSQQSVVTALRGRANTLDGTVKNYRNGLIAAVEAQLAVMSTGAQLSNLTNQRLRKATEMNNKLANVAGLQASGEDEAKAFGSLTASFADVQAALDSGAFVQFGNTHTFELDGQDGKFTGSSTPTSSVASHTITGLTAGEMLVVQTSGSWTPTCAISTKRWLLPDGKDGGVTNLSGAVIGPEGYTVHLTQSGAQVSSAARSGGITDSFGASIKLCVGNGPAGDYTGIKTEACIHRDQTHSQSTTWSNSTATESTTSASFAVGLRLDDTPFPAAPVGSLLVVLQDPATGVIRDVRVVHSGGTSILVEGASTAYFVVNDKQCSTAGTTNKLTVTARSMLGGPAVAKKALVAMADVLALMRQQQTLLAAQGTMLPTQAALIRQQADNKLQERLGEISVTALPAPLASLFDAFVSHEIVATERRIEIAAVKRSLDLDLIELRMIDDEIKAGGDRARLQRLVPQWLLRDLDHDHLRVSLVDLLSVTRDYLKPILDLWYPHALDNVSFGPEITALLNADVDTSLVSLAASGQTFVNTLLDAYDTATFGAKPNAPQLPLVVLSFPRPGATPSNTFWRTADAARAQRVWDAIDNQTVAHFEITPDDFYSRMGGDAVLSCNEAVPLIKTMAIYVVRPGADSSNQTLNAIGRTFQGSGGANQSFVTPEGPRLYQLADAATGAPSVWRSFNLPVRYGESEASLTTFLNTPRQTRPVGLSAAGAFDIDFSVLSTLPQQGGLGANDPAPATEIQLVLEIDSRASGTLPTWVSRCK